MPKPALAALLVCGLATSLAVGGCSADATEQTTKPTAQQRTQALWRDRTPYVGNNSKVSALLDDAGFGDPGRYTVSLHTKTPPYGLTVTYQDGNGGDPTTFEPAAILLLGTVENLQTVHVVTSEGTASWTARQVTKQLGHNVKDLGRDQAKLSAYVTSLQG